MGAGERRRSPAAGVLGWEVLRGRALSARAAFKDIELTFGQSAELNEMCIFNADYFPAPDSANIDCLF
jgi:hypothetical protein